MVSSRFLQQFGVNSALEIVGEILSRTKLEQPNVGRGIVERHQIVGERALGIHRHDVGLYRIGHVGWAL